MSASLATLLRHEVQLGLRLGGGSSRLRWAAGMVLLASGPVVLGWLTARTLGMAPITPGPAAMALLVLAHAALIPLMISLASVQVLRTFRDRGDLDLLLTAPMPPQRVFLAKALAACWMVAMPFMVLMGPFVLFCVLQGHWRWAAALLVLLATAAVATGLGFFVVAGLIDWLGGRRARMAVHLGSAALGAGIFIVSQISGLTGGAAEGRTALLAKLAASMPPQPLDWGARAMVGEPWPLLAFAGLGVASLRLAVGPGARRLAVRDAEESDAGGDVRAVNWHGGAWWALVIKELRLLWRDPETLAQVLLRFVYLLPLMFLATRDNVASATVARQLLGGGVALSVMAASSLAWITVCAEEARELVEAAPIARWRLNAAKLSVACGLPLVALLPLAVWLASFDLRAGLMMLPLAVVATLSMASVQAWHGPRVPRTAFRKKPAALLLMGLIEIAMAGIWAAVSVLAFRGTAWVAVPLGLVLLIVGVARALKR